MFLLLERIVVILAILLVICIGICAIKEKYDWMIVAYKLLWGILGVYFLFRAYCLWGVFSMDYPPDEITGAKICFVVSTALGGLDIMALCIPVFQKKRWHRVLGRCTAVALTALNVAGVLFL